MVPEMPTVVAPQDHDRAVVEPEALHLGEDLADLGVDVAHAREVRVSRTTGLGLRYLAGTGRPRVVGGQFRAVVQADLRIDVFRWAGILGKGNLVPVVQVPVLLGGVVGEVGFVEADGQEEASILQPPELLDGLLGVEAVGVSRVGHLGRLEGRHIAVVLAEAVGSNAAVRIAEEGTPWCLPGTHRRVRQVPTVGEVLGSVLDLIGGMVADLANAHGSVAVAHEQAGHGHVHSGALRPPHSLRRVGVVHGRGGSCAGQHRVP